MDLCVLYFLPNEYDIRAQPTRFSALFPENYGEENVQYHLKSDHEAITEVFQFPIVLVVKRIYPKVCCPKIIAVQ